MANTLRANTFYIDGTSGTLSRRNARVIGVIVTTSAANAVLAIKDTTVAGTVLSLKVAAAGQSQHFDFSASPIQFPNGIEASTVTNCEAMVILEGA
jgi:hypothetical protein